MAERLAIPTRDELVAKYERNYLLLNPGGKTGEGTVAGQDARLTADMLLPIYAEASRIASGVALEDRSIEELRLEARELGIPEQLPATGATGAVTIVTSVGGASLLAGAQLVHQPTGLRFSTLVSGTFLDGSQVAVGGIDSGPTTNLPAGSVLTWTSPSPGLGSSAVVVEQGDGSGLSGGRNAEGKDGIVARIRDAQANPPVAGSAAAYRAATFKAPGIPVQAAFAYPASLGPGTTGLAFTLQPSRPGGSRIPNSTQIAAVRAHLRGQFPADDGLLVDTILPELIYLSLKVRWKPGASGWVDSPVWPPAGFLVTVGTVTSATAFVVSTANSSPPNPQAGQSIAVFDISTGAFKRKRVATVSAPTVFGGTTSWSITCDVSNAASDTAFAPATSARVSPWSDSLDGLPAGVLAAFDATGPGEEITGSTYDLGGRRALRDPPVDGDYPAILSSRLLTPLYAAPGVQDVQVFFPTLPYVTAPGTPGVSVNLLQLADLAILPL